jgi:hypothetical protein
MRWIYFGGVVLSSLFMTSTSAAAPYSLKTFEARSAAESAAFDFQIKHDLDENSVGRCQRKAPRKIVCEATVGGETSTATQTCTLRISVRAVYRTFYWDEIASIVQRRCKDEAKPLLTYQAALAAIQAEADRFANQNTRVTSVYRRDDVTYTARAEWERPRVPPSELIPTESCSVSLVATLAGEITVTTEGFYCL